MAVRGDTEPAAEIGGEDLWQGDRAVGFLAVLQHRDQGAADGEAGAVQGVDELGRARPRRGGSGRSSGGPGSRRRPRPRRSRGRCPGRAARPRGRGCGGAPKPMSPVAEHDGAVGQARAIPGSLWAHFVIRASSAAAVLGAGDRDHLDLLELVLAQHAGGVLAGAAGLGAEALGVGGHADGKLRRRRGSRRRRGWSA